MTKKVSSTYDTLVASLTASQKKEFEEGYRDLLISEMLIAMMKEDAISVRKLAEASGVSPTIIQGMRSGTRKNISMQSFFKILKGLGYDLVAERKGNRIALDLTHSLQDEKVAESSSRRK